jgi:hypothetical protein
MSTRSKQMTSSSLNMMPGRPNLTTEAVPFDFIEVLYPLFDITVASREQQPT